MASCGLPTEVEADINCSTESPTPSQSTAQRSEIMECSYCREELQPDTGTEINCSGCSTISHICDRCLAKASDERGAVLCNRCGAYKDMDKKRKARGNQDEDRDIAFLTSRPAEDDREEPVMWKLCQDCKDVNKESKAVKHCDSHCRKWFCEKHLKEHNDGYGQDHTMTDVENPDLQLLPSVCPKGHQAIACSECYQMMCCNNCKSGEPIPNCSEGEHHWEPAIDDQLNAKFGDLINKINLKDAKYSDSSTQADAKYKELEKNCNKLEKDVKEMFKIKILKLEKDQKKILKRIADHKDGNATRCGTYKNMIDERKRKLATQKTDIENSLDGSTYNKIRKREKQMNSVEEISREEIPSCSFTANITMTYKVPQREFEVILSEVPSSLTFENKICEELGESCFSVCINEDGKLWIGHRNGLKFIKAPAQGPLEKASQVAECISLASNKCSTYFTVEDTPETLCAQSNHTGMVKAFLNAGDKPAITDIFSYTIERDLPARIAASENLLALTDNHKEQVSLYCLTLNKMCDHIIPGQHSGVCFHPSGQLLLTSKVEGKVKAYSIDISGRKAPELQWEIPNLEEPESICCDSFGQVYVRSGTKQSIYVITEELTGGKVLCTLEDPEIPTAGSTMGEMDIHDDTLVMACWDDKVFKRFKIERQRN